MRFDVVEYLKGSGSRSIVVEAPDRRNSYLTEQEAVREAEAMAASFDPTSHGRDGVVFLVSELDEGSSRMTRTSSQSSDRFASRGFNASIDLDTEGASSNGSSGDSSGETDLRP